MPGRKVTWNERFEYDDDDSSAGKGISSQDVPPQTNLSGGGTCIQNDKDELEFETLMVIKGLPDETIVELKEIYKRQRNDSKHTSIETFVLDNSIVEDKAKTDQQHFLWLVGMFYKDVQWDLRRYGHWVVKAVEDVKSGDLVCPSDEALARANKVGMRKDFSFRGDDAVGKYAGSLILRNRIRFKLISCPFRHLFQNSGVFGQDHRQHNESFG